MNYLLFAWSKYYPNGGAGDFVGSYSSVDDAETAFRAIQLPWEGATLIGHVVTFDGGRFPPLLWLCRDGEEYTVEALARLENGLL